MLVTGPDGTGIPVPGKASGLYTFVSKSLIVEPGITVAGLISIPSVFEKDIAIGAIPDQPSRPLRATFGLL